MEQSVVYRLERLSRDQKVPGLNPRNGNAATEVLMNKISSPSTAPKPLDSSFFTDGLNAESYLINHY